MKHTPAPWRISRPSVANGVQILKDWDTPAKSDVICKMPESGNIAANARLIAAAPELLAALQKLVAADNRNDERNTLQYEELLDEARYIIAQAKGLS